MTRPSGPAWCDEFPCSVLITNLVEPFRTSAHRFVNALCAAGARVEIHTTYRPAERAYLMHYAFLIAEGRMLPGEVPPMEGVDVDWTHAGSTAAARQAARAMVRTYGIAYCPVLTSRHTQGRAVDMTVQWCGTVRVLDSRGVAHSCYTQEDLWPIGASYGVHKLVIDPPHWSDDGH